MSELVDNKFKEYNWKILKNEKHAERFESRGINHDEFNKLKEKVERLSAERDTSRLVARSEADEVYEMHKEQLERDHMDEIVAFDIDTKEIVAFGSSLREAFDNAREHRKKEQFYFKRIGSRYLDRL